MTAPLPSIYLARHGETAWSLSGQHTGLTDIPLTERGERNAKRLSERLAGLTFRRVYTSPSQRARRTAELAGFGARAEIDPDLAEWNYGDYEGKTSAEIRQGRPNWQVFRDGCPGGESVAQATARADRVRDRLRGETEQSLVFSSGHFLRLPAARWVGLDTTAGSLLLLNTATVSILGFENLVSQPVIALWNDGRHVGE